MSSTHPEPDGAFLDDIVRVDEIVVAASRSTSGSRRTGALWSGETSITSAGSIRPLTRTSPAASVAMRDVPVSPMRAAVR